MDWTKNFGQNPLDEKRLDENRAHVTVRYFHKEDLLSLTQPPLYGADGKVFVEDDFLSLAAPPLYGAEVGNPD